MNPDILTAQSVWPILGTALLLGWISPMIGIVLVMRRFSLLADTLAHVSLFGVAVSSWFSLPMAVGAFASAVLGGGGIELFRRSRRVLSEATLAIFLSGSLALAVMLFALRGVEAEEIEAYLFGNLAWVNIQDFFLVFGIASVVTLFFGAFYRQLFLATLDEDLARVNGVSVDRLNLVFMLLASTVVAAAIKVVGVLLVSSLVVLPVMAALQWRLGFKKTLLLSLILAEGSASLGFSLAFIGGLPSGASIALVTLIVFALSYLANSRKTA
ncbi:MAG: metal ABC transporter permease [Candidatus Moraniibacteriota bacterium]|nr:MAG: metal ABC transporter permease [Candidatus Moranbacteria bacterium]